TSILFSLKLSDNIRSQFRMADTLQRIILVNVVVYLGFAIVRAIMKLFMSSLDVYFIPSQWLAVPASLHALLLKPWTLITYMFYHEEFFHILFNMLWLFWMGKIFKEYLGNKKLLSTYVLGGISGAVLYIVAYNVFPLFSESVNFSFALGASAGVLAITVAAATLLPDYRIGLMFIGPVALKYIAIVTVFLDLISVSGANAGGHIAHLGGAIFGFIYVKQLKQGRDIASWFNNLVDRIVSLFKGRSRMKVHYKRSAGDDAFVSGKKIKQERTDEILDKISKSGYGSLTNEEREFLFKSSREN
ncbi:MAG: rhomboid family intramembrane serine protease, partial [Bacteroidota bacterium]